MISVGAYVIYEGVIPLVHETSTSLLCKSFIAYSTTSGLYFFTAATSMTHTIDRIYYLSLSMPILYLQVH